LNVNRIKTRPVREHLDQSGKVITARACDKEGKNLLFHGGQFRHPHKRCLLSNGETR
jgi:hypothetical protein